MDWWVSLTETEGTAVITAGCNQANGSDDRSTRTPAETTSKKSTTTSAEIVLPEFVPNSDAIRTYKTDESTSLVGEWHSIPVVAGPTEFYSPWR